MKRSTQVLWFAALVAIFVAFRWLDGRQSASPQTPRADPAPVAAVKPAAPSHVPPPAPAPTEPVTTIATSAQQQELPRLDVPLDQAVPRLRELADAGNVDAQFQLTVRLYVCTPVAQRQSEASDERDRKTMAEDANDERWTEAQRATRRRVQQQRLDLNAAERAGCEKIAADLRANWLDPLERAARSGSTAAMRLYAKWAIEQYDSVNAVVADVDNAILRRDKARAYLLEAVRRGDAEGLADLARAYSDGSGREPRLFAADPFQSYLYAYAGSLSHGLAPVQYGNLEALMDESAKSLDARRLADAQARGRRLYEQCCVGK